MVRRLVTAASRRMRSAFPHREVGAHAREFDRALPQPFGEVQVACFSNRLHPRRVAFLLNESMWSASAPL
ncbi:MAG: hypothetical protein JWM63_825 [Gammaproteobacteria bacterium]|jgi:hypothetical protein|nr:hypothetical protein [Gammaproteobacteria bacterium]